MHAYGFRINAQKRARINSNFSAFQVPLSVVPQESILGPIFKYIYK